MVQSQIHGERGGGGALGNPDRMTQESGNETPSLINRRRSKLQDRFRFPFLPSSVTHPLIPLPSPLPASGRVRVRPSPWCAQSGFCLERRAFGASGRIGASLFAAIPPPPSLSLPLCPRSSANRNAFLRPALKKRGPDARPPRSRSLEV